MKRKECQEAIKARCPAPWCDSKPYVRSYCVPKGKTYWYRIVCAYCLCHGPVHTTPEVAITAWNIREKEMTRDLRYKNWKITWEDGYYTAYSDDYNAEWTEDGWVDNGLKVSVREITDIYAAIDEKEQEL